MGRKYIWVELCVKIFTYLILCEKLFRKSHVSENWPKIAQNSPKRPKKGPKFKKKTKKPEKASKKPKKARHFKIAKKAQKSPKKPEFFWVYMGIFFIEAVKKSPGIKILSLVIKNTWLFIRF